MQDRPELALYSMRSGPSPGPLCLWPLSSLSLSSLFTKSSPKAAWEVGVVMDPASQGCGLRSTHTGLACRVAGHSERSSNMPQLRVIVAHRTEVGATRAGDWSQMGLKGGVGERAEDM